MTDGTEHDPRGERDTDAVTTGATTRARWHRDAVAQLEQGEAALGAGDTATAEERLWSGVILAWRAVAADEQDPVALHDLADGYERLSRLSLAGGDTAGAEQFLRHHLSTAYRR
ncbi:MAG TPA: hypothetical protein VEZ42_19480, partial [Pseudonocardia sp.]|nr:hypothetical protein [Pseudonocardia sp.]